MDSEIESQPKNLKTIMLYRKVTWLIPVALTLFSFVTHVKQVNAQTKENIYKFSITYDALAIFGPVFNEEKNILDVAVIGQSIGDAPFGLTNFDSRTYGRFEERGTQIFSTFDADPSVFGIDGNIRGDRYFGGSNELFGRASDSAVIDLVQQTIVGGGIINITGGTGLFKNATGLITFTQSDRLSPTSTEGPLTSRGVAVLNFTIRTPQTVPEPTNTTTLTGLGLAGAGLLLQHRRRFKSY
ncbi:hypothetical protein NIES2111_64000 (plasmid) [Nostoc sp. NIES-2111]|nr:hypothetical protein NIES2111_64000 [Nostoc sp. NIES-2111]